MKFFEIKSKNRIKTGKRTNKRSRKINYIPCIIYGKNKKNIKIKIKHNKIYNIIEKNNKIKKKIFLIKLKEKIIKCKITEIQIHPVKKKIIHIDFIYY